MPQLYCQVLSRPDSWLLVRTSAELTTLKAASAVLVAYHGGGYDTIPAGSVATAYGTGASTFDTSQDVYVIYTVQGSGALQVVKEADLVLLTGNWAGLARIVHHWVAPYQPEAYIVQAQAQPAGSWSGGASFGSGSSWTGGAVTGSHSSKSWTGGAVV